MDYKMSLLSKICAVVVTIFPLTIILFSVENIFFLHFSYATQTEFASSLTPIGSGARALGIGGAFIAVADDATAASWNPAGLCQLNLAELSFVTSYFDTTEKIKFGKNPEGNSIHNTNDFELNYFSLVFPLKIFRQPIEFSLSHQNLYRFNRNWTFQLNDQEGSYQFNSAYQYKQTGNLSALGLSLCFRLLKTDKNTISLGFTLNIWDDNIAKNHWKQNYYKILNYKQTGQEAGVSYSSRKETFSFNGLNMNFGLLWQKDRFTLGCVIKTPFTAKINRENTLFIESSPVLYENLSEKMRMPGSFGIGCSYLFKNLLRLSADLYVRDWRKFSYKNADGTTVNPISGKLLNISTLSSTIHFRIGTEYIIDNYPYYIPIRAGLFYDPSPAVKSHDDYYGLSFGFGLFKHNKFKMDFAYSFRFGKDVGKDFLTYRKFTQDVIEHCFYTSVTWHFNFNSK